MLAMSTVEATMRIINDAPSLFLSLLTVFKGFHKAYIDRVWLVVKGWIAI